ncbi:MAG: hypothetical protein WA960_06605 [Tunicatimonas sp.]
MKNKIRSGLFFSLTPLLLSFALVFMVACEDESSKIPSIAGYYRVESLKTDQQVDLNNDGIASEDLMVQISESNFITQYLFDWPDSYLEIRPTKYNDNFTQLMLIPFPNPVVTFTNSNSSNGAVSYLNNNLNGVGYEYSYNEETKINVSYSSFLEIVQNQAALRSRFLSSKAMMWG